jgi:hypothetical protein
VKNAGNMPRLAGCDAADAQQIRGAHRVRHERHRAAAQLSKLKASKLKDSRALSLDRRTAHRALRQTGTRTA